MTSNDTHLAEPLAEREGIAISGPGLQPILWAACLAQPAAASPAAAPQPP